MKIYRQYIPSYGADRQAISHGLKWLMEDNLRVAVHVPSLNQIHGGSVLTKELGRDIVREFRKTGKLKINGKYITVITDRKQLEIESHFDYCLAGQIQAV